LELETLIGLYVSILFVSEKRIITRP